MKYDNVDIVSEDQKKVQEKQSQMSKLNNSIAETVPFIH